VSPSRVNVVFATGRRLPVTIAVALAFAFAVATPAGAATQVGETFAPVAPSWVSGGSGITDLQSGSPDGQYVVPFTGVITSWSFEATATGAPTLTFKVARPAGGNDFVIVGEDGPRAPTAGVLNTFPTQIPVQAGDLIGDYRVTGGLFARSDGDYSVQTMAGDPAPGTNATFGAPGGGLQLDLSATLEPPAAEQRAAATGQRAAARKKCKKKRSHQQRKKCRKKANRLPL
jgi:hypothetical protein